MMKKIADEDDTGMSKEEREKENYKRVSLSIQTFNSFELKVSFHLTPK